MGTITIQVVETGQTTLTKVYTILDADVDRLVTAYQTVGNVAVNGTATRAQVLLAWANLFMASTVSTVASYEQAVAVAEIVPTKPINPV
jgi:hypothetical protein